MSMSLWVQSGVATTTVSISFISSSIFRKSVKTLADPPAAATSDAAFCARSGIRSQTATTWAPGTFSMACKSAVPRLPVPMKATRSASPRVCADKIAGAPATVAATGTCKNDLRVTLLAIVCLLGCSLTNNKCSSGRLFPARFQW